MLLKLSNQIYKLLLYVYPVRFRREFGREMTQVFRIDTRRTLDEYGLATFISLWLTILIDLQKTALNEHLREIVQKPNSKFIRLAGIAMTIGGALWTVPFSGWLGDISVKVQLLMALPGLILAALGVLGLHLRLRASGSQLSTPAFGLALTGVFLILTRVVTVLLTGPPETNEMFFIIIAGVVFLAIGLIVMGGIALIRQALGALSFVPITLAGGFGTFLISFWLGQNNPSYQFLRPISLALIIICWLLLGAALLFGRQNKTHTTP